LEAIDERLVACSGRSSFSGREHIDTLLELRMLASDLLALQSLEPALGDVDAPDHRGRRRLWARRTVDAAHFRP
jgi:hypothetical protein